MRNLNKNVERLYTFMSSKTPLSSPAFGTQDQRAGLIAGIACYAIWGCMPFLFAALHRASPVEILGHRIVWSLVFCVIVLAVSSRLGKVRAALRDASLVRTLGLATLLILINWLVYVFAVSTSHVLDASLGYFINPLVTVLLAVVVQREKISPLTWVAVGFGTAAVVVLTVGMGKLPWISLALALSFGFYGLIKSRVGSRVDSLTSLSVETLLATPFALVFLIWLASQGESSFGSAHAVHSGLLVASGVITAVPLIFFGFAAQRLPLSTLGILQYLGPTLQFVFGLLVFKEPMPTARWIGFGLVWIAIVLFVFAAARHSRALALAQPKNQPLPR